MSLSLSMEPSSREIMTVSSISIAIKSHIESRFSWVRIKGEVTGAKLHSSGHLYFSLKDESATIAAIGWKGVVSRFPVAVKDGMEIICSGKITTYGMQSKYQMIVETIELAGQGALQQILEERKKKLAAEGLFEHSRKKPLPLLPKLIGLITSPTGAVIQDMLHRLEDRCPTDVILWPVLVQGPGAAEQISAAIDGMQTLNPRPDVIIVARGGGTIEDLWAFNEENVARAVARSQIPIISGVGHEPDVTLIDYVADYRAPTPTAAMEKAVPVRVQLMETINSYAKRLNMHLIRLLEQFMQRLDERSSRMDLSMDTLMEKKLQGLRILASNIKHPGELLQIKELRLHALLSNINKIMLHRTETRSMVIENLSHLLCSYSVQKTLDRGFSIAMDMEGNIIKSSCEIGTTINEFKIRMKDGVVKVNAA